MFFCAILVRNFREVKDEKNQFNGNNILGERAKKFQFFFFRPLMELIHKSFLYPYLLQKLTLIFFQQTI